jgi:hypothetical protein
MKTYKLIFAMLVAVVLSSGFSMPAEAQSANCGGYWGEGCWSPQAREALYRRHHYPQWGHPSPRISYPHRQPVYVYTRPRRVITAVPDRRVVYGRHIEVAPTRPVEVSTAIVRNGNQIGIRHNYSNGGYTIYYKPPF